MSVDTNIVITYDKMETKKVIIELTKNSADVGIVAYAFSPAGVKLREETLWIGDVTASIRNFIPDPANIFNKCDQWLAAKYSGTYSPNTDVVL